MESISKIIACNLKILREKRKLSLEGAARLTGVSKSMLAQIERGDVSPTVVTMRKIADGFKVPFTAFLEEDTTEAELVRLTEIEPLTEDGGRYKNYPLFHFDEKRRFEMYAIELAPECAMEAEAHPPGSMEFITVFQGTLRLAVGEEHWELPSGDSIRFVADRPHRYANARAEPCRLSMVIWYPEP